MGERDSALPKGNSALPKGIQHYRKVFSIAEVYGVFLSIFGSGRNIRDVRLPLYKRGKGCRFTTESTGSQSLTALLHFVKGNATSTGTYTTKRKIWSRCIIFGSRHVSILHLPKAELVMREAIQLERERERSWELRNTSWILISCTYTLINTARAIRTFQKSEFLVCGQCGDIYPPRHVSLNRYHRT